MSSWERSGDQFVLDDAEVAGGVGARWPPRRSSWAGIPVDWHGAAGTGADAPDRAAVQGGRCLTLLGCDDAKALLPLLGDLEEALGDFIEGVQAGGVSLGPLEAAVVEDHGFFAVPACGVEWFSREGEFAVSRRDGRGFSGPTMSSHLSRSSAGTHMRE
ncbi:hypothetical protein [Streptomyces sp. 8ZJF_21]|uniref:hypothetical protein n=1 Tax=Streptomyces sp. 8ZJF_21 TaxID=2903141 RepID=UPI001E4E1C2F|nr:hypothetical protein [Streptomyces sp. 8ZJF_21]MCD9589382.1 hypothetical protein [Streptomyces sp. 8ZJF_21]